MGVTGGRDRKEREGAGDVSKTSKNADVAKVGIAQMLQILG